MALLERIIVEPLPAYTGLNQESAVNYFRAKFTVLPLLKDLVISPFEALLKEYTCYNDNNLPEQPETKELTLGEITFAISSEKRIKRPGLLEVYEGLCSYLQHLQDGHSKGIKRKGVRTINNQPYVLLDDVIGKLDELKSGVEVDEIKQSVKNDWKGEYNGPLVVPISTRVQLVEADALLYVRAEALENKIRSETSLAFEHALKVQTGYDKSNVPEKIEIKWVQMGTHLFRVKTIPEQTVSYANIIKSLMKEPPEKITSRSTYGELIAIRDGLPFNDAAAESLYQLNVDHCEKLISIQGTLERVAQLKKEHTNPSINQLISHYPLV